MKQFYLWWKHNSILRVCLIYLVIGCLWIGFSDSALQMLAGNLETYDQWQSYKGWFYVLATTIMLYSLMVVEAHARTQLEQRYQKLFEASPDAIFLISPTGEILNANLTATHIYGYGREEFKLLRLTDLTHHDTTPLAEKTSEVQAIQADHYRKDGSRFSVEYTVTWFDGRDLNGAIYTIHDITERKAIEQAHEAYAARYYSLFQNSPTPLWEEDFSQVLLRLEELKAQGITDFPAYFAAHPEDLHDCSGRVTILNINDAVVKLYRANSREEFMSNLDFVFSDESYLAFAQELACIAEGQRVFDLEFPTYTMDRQRLNTLIRWAVAPGYETTLEKVYISVTDITTLTQAQTAMRDAQSKLEAIVSTMMESLLVTDLNGGIIFANSAAVRLLNLQRDPAEAYYNLPQPSLFVDQQAQPIAYEQLELVKAAREGHSVQNLDYQMRIDGKIRWVSVNAAPQRDLEGAMAGVVITLRDVDAEKQIQVQNRQQIERLAVLRNIDHVINSTLDLDVTLKVLLDEVAPLLKADAIGIFLVNTHLQYLSFAAGKGFQTRMNHALMLRMGEGYPGQAALRRATLVIPNLRDPSESVKSDVFPFETFFAREEFVAYAATPLIAKGQVKGVLEVYHREPFEATEDWRQLLETLAGQAVIAIDNAALFENQQRMTDQLTLAYDSTIEGWSRALDLRDQDTQGHSQRVTVMTLSLARLLGTSSVELMHIQRGALLHDIGKMGIPDAILQKPGALNEQEWEIMRKHPTYSFELLSPIEYLRPALDIPFCHHEKWDGSGYPRGLKGEEIPLAARIFAVVDVWDALTSDRPYRKALTQAAAEAFIRSQIGLHFDPRVVELFFDHLDELIG